MFLSLRRKELSLDVVALFSTHEHSEGRGYQNEQLCAPRDNRVVVTGEQASGQSW